MDSVAKVEFWQRLLDHAVEWVIASGTTIVVILIVALIVSRLLNFSIRRLEAFWIERGEKEGGGGGEFRKRVTTITSLVQRAARIALGFIVFMLVLRELGVDIAPIIAGAGIIGLAVGFGAQNLVRDVISGFFMILENQIRKGDVVQLNGTGGLVEAVNLRTTVLRDLSGIVHVFPNGSIQSLANMTMGWSAMVFEIGVAYKEDPDAAMKHMRRVDDSLRNDEKFRDKILEPMEVFGVESFGDSAVIIKARLKTRPGEQWTVGREYRRRLKQELDAAGIEIPFPHRTLYFGDASRPFAITQATAAE